jgi:RNA-directed DNA polymerase
VNLLSLAIPPHALLNNTTAFSKLCSAITLCFEREAPVLRCFAISFDTMAHPWIIRFLEHRIADKRILRLIVKWLKVGTVEDGRRTRGVCGAPEGAVISPILANAYLHYVFDLWVHRWRLTKASGDMIVIRYADDSIVGFQHEHEARVFLDDLKERMRKFELALHPDKTRLIRFGRHAAKQREKLGEGKPETFDFLGFSVLQRHIERRAIRKGKQCRKAA